MVHLDQRYVATGQALLWWGLLPDSMLERQSGTPEPHDICRQSGTNLIHMGIYRNKIICFFKLHCFVVITSYCTLHNSA